MPRLIQRSHHDDGRITVLRYTHSAGEILAAWENGDNFIQLAWKADILEERAAEPSRRKGAEAAEQLTKRRQA
jgi:DNA-binding MarR family transcriptional regulator